MINQKCKKYLCVWRVAFGRPNKQKEKIYQIFDKSTLSILSSKFSTCAEKIRVFKKSKSLEPRKKEEHAVKIRELQSFIGSD